MSVFTDKELDYLAGQRLGRIATVGADGQPHVVPTSFRYNAEHDAIDVGGLRMSTTKKLRDVQRTGRASIVIDDVLPPWQPRMIEIRGTAAVIPSGGKAFGERFRSAAPLHRLSGIGLHARAGLAHSAGTLTTIASCVDRAITTTASVSADGFSSRREQRVRPDQPQRRAHDAGGSRVSETELMHQRWSVGTS